MNTLTLNKPYPIVQAYDQKTGRAVNPEESFQTKERQVFELEEVVLIPADVALMMQDVPSSSTASPMALIYRGQIAQGLEENSMLFDLAELARL